VGLIVSTVRRFWPLTLPFPLALTLPMICTVALAVVVAVAVADPKGVCDWAQPVTLSVRQASMTTIAPRLHHEELDAYQAAVEFLALATTVIAHFARGNAGLADQLRRASLSIPLNIAEGYGKRSGAERCHYYDIARGSAHECGAVFDASKILGLVDDDRFA
jgi:four helix bundle protein